MLAVRFVKTLLLIAAIAVPLLLAAGDSAAESGCHRQGPSGGSTTSNR